MHTVLSKSAKASYVSCVSFPYAISSPLTTYYPFPHSAVNGALVALPVCSAPRWLWSCRIHFTIERLLNHCNICFNDDISFMSLCLLCTVCELRQSAESQYVFFICCR